MECPICGSGDLIELNTKIIPSKKKEIKEYLLQCESCQHIFKHIISEKKPIMVRLIISEQEQSIKSSIELFPNDEVAEEDILMSDLGQVQVTSIESEEKRVKKSFVDNIKTIWASSIEIPARVGISVDLHGKVISYKVDIDRHIEIAIGDIIRIEDNTIKIHSIKTNSKSKSSGYAKSSEIKRIYGKPIDSNNYDYDFSQNIVKKTNKVPKFLRK